MKKLNFLKVFAIFCVLAFNFVGLARAQVMDGFFLEPFLTVEFSAPELSSGGVNTEFKTDSIDARIGDLSGIALGGHFRIHKYLGLNVNWSQERLHSELGLQDFVINSKPRFSMDYYNFSLLAFLPVIEDSLLEFFVEGGVSDMESKLSFDAVGAGFTSVEDHQTNPFVGLGFQFAPFEEEKDAFRFSALRYVDKISVLDTDLTVFRIGYVKRF